MPKNCTGWQKFLTKNATAAVATDILSSIESKSDKANFLGYSHPFSSAWLSAMTTNDSKIKNDVFLEALGTRCGVPTTSEAHACRCSAGSTKTISPSTALQHAHSSSNEAKSGQDSRHESIKWIFTNEMRTIVGLNNVVAEKAGQHVADKSGYMTRLEKNGNFNKNATDPSSYLCADLFVKLGDLNLALDVNISFPGGANPFPSRMGEDYGVTRGSVADQNSIRKHEKYAKLYDFDPKFFAPITFETNGCPGASTVAFLSTVKQWVRKNGSSIQKKSIGTCIRRLTIKTSVSLASSLGSAILAYRKVCQKGAGRVGA